MLTLFLLDGFFLWGSVGICAILLGTCVYAERYSLATLDVLALMGLLAVTGNFNIGASWAYCLHNPMIVVGAVAGFFAVGVAWARIKWGLLTDRLKDEVDAWRAEIALTNKNNAAAFEKAKNAYAEWKIMPLVERQSRRLNFQDEPLESKPKTVLECTPPYELRNKIQVDDDGRIRVVIENFKSKIIGWMAYWPVSMFLWVTGDFIHDLFNKLYMTVRDYFQRLADDKLNA